jgi:transcriptional regulator with XRE-family HTH domain
MDIQWIEDGLKKEGKSKKGLAAALGRFPSAVSDLLKNRRRLRADEIQMIAEYLEVTPPTAGTRLAPLVGYVGAGAEAHLFDHGQGPFDMVDAPDGSTDATVAVEIRGESMGSFFDKWLVFYDDVRDPPSPDMIGKICVVGLPDGRVLIKKLARSREKGLYVLHSQFEPPIYDVAILWAAKVKNMVPR